MSEALAIRDLAAGYGPLRVLHGIDLSVQPGERVGIVGLNGHGKTTLLRAVMGLVDWSTGEVWHQGRLISGVATYRLAREGLVLVPQGDAIFPGLSVRENLDSGAYAGSSWRARRQRRAWVLDLFPNLGTRLDQAAGTLSGGERRMLSVGRGLMGSGDVYLMDEVSLGLAPGIATRLVDTLLELDLQDGALVIVEQNRALIDGGVDRVVRIHGGEVATDDGRANRHESTVR